MAGEQGVILEGGERKLKKEAEGASGEVAGTRSGKILMFQVRKYGFQPKGRGEPQLRSWLFSDEQCCRCAGRK